MKDEVTTSQADLSAADCVTDGFGNTKHISAGGQIQSTGGSTDYYKLPKDAHEIQDLIEHKDMNFAEGNIFKAIWRLGKKKGADQSYDLKKIIWYAARLLAARTGKYYTLKECSKGEFHEAWK